MNSVQFIKIHKNHVKNINIYLFPELKKTNFSVWSWSRPNLVEVGSGTLDFRSRSLLKKLRLRNIYN